MSTSRTYPVNECTWIEHHPMCTNKQIRAYEGLIPFSTHFQPMFLVYTPWDHQKTRDFLMFSGGIGVEDWLKMG